MKHKHTILLIQQYPFELIQWKKQLFSKEELIGIIKKLENKNINPDELHQEILRAMRTTSGWKPTLEKEKIDFNEALDNLLN